MVFTFRLHAQQKRKVGDVPYISHLFSVAALVMEDGGDEDEAIAGLLHDAVEDQGGMPILIEICERFGEKVSRIVEGCTDSYGKPKPPWKERKQRYLEILRSAPEDVRRVSLADKVHNARMIVSSLKQQGESVWDCFKGGRDGTLWYYDQLVSIFQETGNGYLTDELTYWVREMNQLTGEPGEGI
jgi:(p)ppGpp synthase/HD superfamily hydrolase